MIYSWKMKWVNYWPDFDLTKHILNLILIDESRVVYNEHHGELAAESKHSSGMISKRIMRLITLNVGHGPSGHWTRSLPPDSCNTGSCQLSSMFLSNHRKCAKATIQMARPQQHWTTDNSSEMHMCQFQHPCVLILKCTLALAIYLFGRFNFDALAQGNAYNPQDTMSCLHYHKYLSLATAEILSQNINE